MEKESFLTQNKRDRNQISGLQIISLIRSTVKMRRMIFISLLSLGVFIYWVEIKFVFQDGYIVLKDFFSAQEDELSDFISWEEYLQMNDSNLISSDSKDLNDLMKKFQAQQDFYYEDPVCPLPRTPLVPDYLKEAWKPVYKLDCDFERDTVVLENDQVLRKLTGVNGENENQQCCVQEIFRKTDFKYRQTDCQPFTDVIDVRNREVLAIKCNDSINMEANIPIKASAKEKINYWSKFPVEDRPYNVLIFGFDTTSRLQAYRSFPKTIELMKKLGFIDFKSYHSVYPATLPNFMGFLMGIPPRVHRIPFTCAKSYMSPFDICPFIWKNFTEQHYITNYIEDATQTFNFKAQSGFEKPPTDYYFPHLFVALRDMRKEQEEKFREGQKKFSEENGNSNSNSNSNSTRVDVSCTSRETTPEFVLRYTRRFAEKFANTPFFSFSWMNNPFHDNYHAHTFMETPLLLFFRKIMTKPEILDRTFIFYLSDHGDRNTDFSVNSFESYFERVLPPLFIRVPDAFKRRFPQMADNLLKNSYRFVTPYDIHHTLLHLLSIGSDMTTSSGSRKKHMPQIFRTVSTHKASLFTVLPPDRDCKTARIQDVACKCHVTYDKKGDDEGENSENKSGESETSFKIQMLSYLVQELNAKVRSPSYINLCEEWTSNNISRIISYHKMQEDERLVTFTADPAQATFQASFKIRRESGSGKEYGFELLGFSRMSAYGETSWCLEIQSDVDKEMKGFCYCKEQLPKNLQKRN